MVMLLVQLQTITHPLNALKVLPQLSSELWSAILRQRSMQIEVLRVEKLNRHREPGYQAVLTEMVILSWKYVHLGDHGIPYTRLPWWTKYDYNDYKARYPRKRTKNGTLYKKWVKYLPVCRYRNVRLLYVCPNDLRAGTVSNHL
jgi:hypothetical protein